MSNFWKRSSKALSAVRTALVNNLVSLQGGDFMAAAVAAYGGAIEATHLIPERALLAFPGMRVVFVNGDARIVNDPRSFVPMPAIQASYWVNSLTGSDSANGAEKTPFKSIWRAQSAANTGGVPTLINIFAGRYSRHTGFSNGNSPSTATDIATVPVVYRTIGGEVTWYGGGDLTWSLDTGTTWKATRNNVSRVYDFSVRNAKGDYAELAKASTVELCRTTPNSWFLDTGAGIVYVNRQDAAAVTNANTAALLNSVPCLEMTTSGNMSLLGKWRFLGGSAGNVRLQGNATGRCYIENAAFQGVANSTGLVDSLTVLDVEAVVLNKCRFYGSAKDGANFHKQNNVIANALLVNCEGEENGLNVASASNNDVTTHDGGLLVEIGGDFTKSYGGNCAHADPGTLAVHIGTTAYDSYGDVARGGAALAGTAFHAINQARIVKIGCKRGVEQLTTSGTIDNYMVV